MSRLARYIMESSSEESSVQDKYDATSFGSQFDSESSDSEIEESYKGGNPYDSDQESAISLTPGEEYVLDTLFGWMDRPFCDASKGQSLLLATAQASALQNVSANRNLYLLEQAANSTRESDTDSDSSDSDSFITQEVEEYSEGPEQSYSEAKDAPDDSNFREEDDYDMADDEGSRMEDKGVPNKVDEPDQPKRSKEASKKVKPSVVSPGGNGRIALEAGDSNLDSESQGDGSDSDEMVEQPTGSDDDTSAAHRVSFLKTVLKKKGRKGKTERAASPSNVFEPPSKKTPKTTRKNVPVEVKISGEKAVGVPADVQVVASSKKVHPKVPPQSSEALKEKLSEVLAAVPLEVSVAMDAEAATGVPAEIQTKPEKPTKTRGRSPSHRKKPSPVNEDDLNSETVDIEVKKTPSLESLAAKIAQQRNAPRKRSNRDPTPTRPDARSMMEEKEARPEIDQHAQGLQVQEAIEIDPTERKEPLVVGYRSRSPRVNNTMENHRAREPRRNSRPDPTEVSEPVVHSEPVEETMIVEAKVQSKATRAKRLSSKKKSRKAKRCSVHSSQTQQEDKIEASSPVERVAPMGSKKKKVYNHHPGQPQQEVEIEASIPVAGDGPVGSITVQELKETLSELSHPHPQQKQSRVKEESKHIRMPSIDLDFQDQSPQDEELRQLPSRDTRSPSNGKREPLARSINEGLVLRKSQERSTPVPHSPSTRGNKSPRVQNAIQYAPPLPTNNEDNPIDIEEYMARREMLNREAPRLGLSSTISARTLESPVGAREGSETPRQPPSPRPRTRPEVALDQHSGVTDLPGVSNGHKHGKLRKQRNYYFETQAPRQTRSNNKIGTRQPKQFDSLARNEPPGHVPNHQYDTKKKNKKSSSGRSKSNLASIEDLKQLEKRIEEHFRNSHVGDNDQRSAVSTKELRKLERQLVLQLRRVEEKRAAKLKRLRNKKKSSRHQQDIVEAEVLAVVPKDEAAAHQYASPPKGHVRKKSADANRFEQLQALRLSKEMGRYMSKQQPSSPAISNRHFQGQAY
ncbi:MAG: hypothetical protein SGBAC_001343 [Bacillariaceae sp.]